MSLRVMNYLLYINFAYELISIEIEKVSISDEDGVSYLKKVREYHRGKNRVETDD